MYPVTLTQSYFPAQSDDIVREITVGELLREIAARYPEDTAVVDIDLAGQVGQSLTYSELLAESERLAVALASRFRPNEKIVVWAPNVIEWLLMQYACALAGIVLVTANPSFQPKELRYVLEQSGAVALFFVDEFRGNPMASISAEAIKGNDNIREVVRLTDTDALYRRGTLPAQLPTVTPSDAAQIQYTSGTTGFPKGAVLSHRGLVNNARFYAGRAEVHQKSVVANFMPLFHTAGCAMGALGSLQAGCKMLLIKLFDADAIVDLIESEGVTFFFAVPTMLVAFLESLAKQPRDVSSMEVITSGGAPVAADLVRSVTATMKCAFQTAFGQTEASPIISQNYSDGLIDDICDSAGQPLPQTAVSIRTVETNEIVPIHTVGEVCVRSYGTMIGYHDKPEATAAALDSEGWLHTGDLGTIDARGFIRITGRVKDMIIRGGENHFPAEIENALLGHPAVAEVAVVGLPDPKWGEIIACFIRSENDQPLDVADLRRFCREQLSPQKTPAVWCRVDAFPLTGSGKIQKFALRDDYLKEKRSLKDFSFLDSK